MKIKTLTSVFLGALALVACDNTTDSLGTSATENNDLLTVSTDTFQISSQSIVVDSILGNSSTGYLGKVIDPETGDEITGDFCAKFHTLTNFDIYDFTDSTFTETDSTDDDGNATQTSTYHLHVPRNANNQMSADSCSLDAFFSTFYGDSLAPMKLTAYEMSKPLSENTHYYSSFDPMANGYIRTNGLKSSKAYTLTDLSVYDSLRTSDGYVARIHIQLNKSYTDKNGNTFNNLGTYLIRKFESNPGLFHNDIKFANNVMPGFYLKHTNGIGSMIDVQTVYLNTYYHINVIRKIVNTTYPSLSKTQAYNSVITATVAGSPEVVQHAHITNSNDIIQKLAADNTCSYVKTPAGIFTQLTIPVNDILSGHEADTINSAKIVMSRLNNTVKTEYAFDPPKNLLIVAKDSMKYFFENRQLPNYLTTYYATYDSSINGYTFNNISSLISNMYSRKGTDPDYDKLILVPVEITKTTSNYTTTITAVNNDLSLTNTRLIGGPENARDPLKISVIYSKFKQR